MLTVGFFVCYNLFTDSNNVTFQLFRKRTMSQTYIRIINGTYRKFNVTGKVFELVHQFKVSPTGSHVTVRNDGRFAGYPDTMRIKVSSISDYAIASQSDYYEDYAMGAFDTADTTEDSFEYAEQEVIESDEEIIERIRSRFDILEAMAGAAVAGDIRAMIVAGPPGVGKSYGVERIVEQAQLMSELGGGTRLRSEIIKGSTSPIGLYCTLYKYSDRNNVVVFDDMDSMFFDDISLNILKGALDSGGKRKISWLADSHMLKREGVPGTFEFKGSVIFLTNLKFHNVKSPKLRDHLDALQSRCHYLDLTLDSQREKILRIKQIADDGKLFDKYNFTDVECTEIIDFISEFKHKIREISLRMAIKIADLRKSFPTDWRKMAIATCTKA